MTGVTPRPPATPRGTNWRLKSFVRIPGTLLVASLITFFTLRWGHPPGLWRIRVAYARAIPVPDRIQEEATAYTFHLNDPLFHALYDYLTAVFSSPLIVTVLAGGFLCTVWLEMRERWRETER